MNKVDSNLKVVPGMIAFGVCAAVVGVFAPLVSVVAVPIFALKALPAGIQYRSLYNRTLTNGSRAKFGRIKEQDYTRWNGKPESKTMQTKSDRIHESIGQYVHGQKSFEFKNYPVNDSPFLTKEDLKWLELEFKRREKKDLLESDLKMLRAFSKALIPIGGLFWVLATETTVGGASEIGCRGCMMGDSDSEDTHWSWREAINYHRVILSEKFKT